MRFTVRTANASVDDKFCPETGNSLPSRTTRTPAEGVRDRAAAAPRAGQAPSFPRKLVDNVAAPTARTITAAAANAGIAKRRGRARAGPDERAAITRSVNG